MKRETEQIIQQTLENVVGYIDQLPNGEFISSEWQPPKGFKNERFKVNDIPVEHLVPKEKRDKQYYISNPWRRIYSGIM